jgi:hypothetical protein
LIQQSATGGMETEMYLDEEEKSKRNRNVKVGLREKWEEKEKKFVL